MNRYVIIEATWPDGVRSLQEKVNEAMKDGYVPAGGVVVFNDKLQGRRMIQAMCLVKKGE